LFNVRAKSRVFCRLETHLPQGRLRPLCGHTSLDSEMVGCQVTHARASENVRRWAAAKSPSQARILRGRPVDPVQAPSLPVYRRPSNGLHRPYPTSTASSTPLSLRTLRPELSLPYHPLSSRQRCRRMMAGMMRRIQLARWSLFPGVATPTFGTQSASLLLPHLAPHEVYLSQSSQQPHHRFLHEPGDSGDSMGMCIWGVAFFVACAWQPGMP